MPMPGWPDKKTQVLSWIRQDLGEPAAAVTDELLMSLYYDDYDKNGPHPDMLRAVNEYLDRLPTQADGLEIVRAFFQAIPARALEGRNIPEGMQNFFSDYRKNAMMTACRDGGLLHDTVNIHLGFYRQLYQDSFAAARVRVFVLAYCFYVTLVDTSLEQDIFTPAEVYCIRHARDVFLEGM